jgi:acetylornithine deacetylase
MRRAFSELGLRPSDVALDPAALDGHPGVAPFAWDVAGRSDVLSNWEPAAPAGGRSLILNGQIDIVSPEPAALWSGAPLPARRDGDWLYGRGDMRSGLAAMVGAVRALQRLRSLRASASSCRRGCTTTSRATSTARPRPTARARPTATVTRTRQPS